MANSHHELDSFVTKFKYLCSAGFKAALSITTTENCGTHVSLNADLPFIAPPCYLPPPTIVTTSMKSPRYRSPSYYRRLRRRRNARLSLFTNEASEMNSSASIDLNEAAMPPNVEEDDDVPIMSSGVVNQEQVSIDVGTANINVSPSPLINVVPYGQALESAEVKDAPVLDVAVVDVKSADDIRLLACNEDLHEDKTAEKLGDEINLAPFD